jgi:hypothetical protein
MNNDGQLSFAGYLITRKARLFDSLNARFSVPVSAAALLTAKRYSFLPV